MAGTSSRKRGAALRLPAAAVLLAQLAGCAGTACRDRWTGPDKAAHFALSGVASAGAASLAGREGADRDEQAAAGIGAAVALGVAKETLDVRADGGCWSWRDLLWGTLGSAAGALLGSALEK